MKAPTLAICGDPECINAINARQVPCCSVCGKCGDHSHEDCEPAVSYRGRAEQ